VRCGTLKDHKMFLGKKLILSFVALGLIASGATAKVLLRWTQSNIPAAKTLGVNEIAIPWNADAKKLVATAKEKGYRVYLEVPAQQAEAIAEAERNADITGLLLAPTAGEEQSAESLLKKLRNAYPKLTFRLLFSHEKPPKMRGHLLFENNGTVQASSPTEQPWVDSNLASIRLAQAFHSDARPLYSFVWEESDPLQKQLGPRVEQYALAIAEASASRADLLLDLPENLQNSLGNDKPEAWATWKQLKPYFDFYALENDEAFPSLASVAVWTDGQQGFYEPVNLMARHNIPFRLLTKEQLNGASVKDMDMLVSFLTPEKEQVAIISKYTSDGGTVVLVGARGSFPWQSTSPVRKTDQSTIFSYGKGKVIEFSGPIVNPETFAQDVRRLMTKGTIPVSLWNSLTTLVMAYRDPRRGQVVLELINYEAEPLQVQVQVKGSFASIVYESPGQACCEALTPKLVDGFTEFVVPLVVGARVHLEPAKITR
jgi:hypothetical protein